MNTWYDSACELMPGGVNSPVRACTGLGMPPLCISKARGKYITDTEGRRHVDFCQSWGALALGHSHPRVLLAARTALLKGSSFGAPCPAELELARAIRRALPSIELLRLVNSGTEAVMTAVRLARAFTKRDIIVKFDGCYHGHSDSMLVSAGSGVAGLARASSDGVPHSVVRDTVSVPFNDTQAIAQALESNAGSVAAIIVEPIPANMGLVLPSDGYLQILRELTRAHGAVLIFDEVITGFRAGPGGAQGRFGVTPDLTCLGKIIGGGLPVGAVGGRRDIMSLLAPIGPVYQAGTLSGNPVAASAGLAVLEELEASPDQFQKLEAMVSEFAQRWRVVSKCTINTCASMFTIFHTGGPVVDFASASRQSQPEFADWYRQCRASGLYVPPSMYETSFVCPQHNDADLNRLLALVPGTNNAR